MELLNILSFIFIIIAFGGAIILIGPLFVFVRYTYDAFKVLVIVSLWLILIAVLAGLGAYITA